MQSQTNKPPPHNSRGQQHYSLNVRFCPLCRSPCQSLLQTQKTLASNQHTQRLSVVAVSNEIKYALATRSASIVRGHSTTASSSFGSIYALYKAMSPRSDHSSEVKRYRARQRNFTTSGRFVPQYDRLCRVGSSNHPRRCHSPLSCHICEHILPDCDLDGVASLEGTGTFQREDPVCDSAFKGRPNCRVCVNNQLVGVGVSSRVRLDEDVVGRANLDTREGLECPSLRLLCTSHRCHHTGQGCDQSELAPREHSHQKQQMCYRTGCLLILSISPWPGKRMFRLREEVVQLCGTRSESATRQIPANPLGFGRGHFWIQRLSIQK